MEEGSGGEGDWIGLCCDRTTSSLCLTLQRLQDAAMGLSKDRPYGKPKKDQGTLDEESFLCTSMGGMGTGRGLASGNDDLPLLFLSPSGHRPQTADLFQPSNSCGHERDQLPFLPSLCRPFTKRRYPPRGFVLLLPSIHHSSAP